MVALAQRVDHVECAHALEAHIREQRLIAVHQPPYNRRSRRPGKVSLGHPDRRGLPAAEHRSNHARSSRRSASARFTSRGRPRRPPSRRCRTRCRSDVARARIRRIESGRESLRAGRTRPMRRAVRRRGGRSLSYCRAHRIGSAQLIDGRSDEMLRLLRERLTDAVAIRSVRPGGADPRPTVGPGRRQSTGGSDWGRWPASARWSSARPDEHRRVGPDGHPIRPVRCRRPGPPRGRSDAGGRAVGVVCRNGAARARPAAGRVGRGDEQRCCGGWNVRARGWCGRRLPGSARPPVPDDGGRS